MKIDRLFAIAVAGMIALTAGAAAAQDAKAGSKVFRKCKACHEVVAGKNKLGPSLHGIIGRKAGTVEKFRYSKAMKNAGADGLTWTEEALDKFLQKPKKFLPKTKMVFPGLRKKEDRDNVIAYLKQASM